MSVSVSLSFLPEFNSRYFHASRKAYNMAIFLTQKLNFDGSVFNAALSYYHIFIQVHGLHAIHEVVLISACTFLAAKVSHYKFKAGYLVQLAFDLEDRQEEVQGYLSALLDVELLLCETLQFDFHVPNPTSQMEQLIENVADQLHMLPAEEEYIAMWIGRVKRLYMLLIISPLLNRVSVADLSHSLLHLVGQHTLMDPALTAVQQRYCHAIQAATPKPSAAVHEGVLSVVVETFWRMKKWTHLASLDQLIKEREREALLGNPSAAKDNHVK